MELFVIDRIVGDIAVLQNMNTLEIIEVKKSEIIGSCDETNVLIKNAVNYVFSLEETTKRTNYIKEISNSIWK